MNEWNLTDEAREAIAAGGWEVQGREYTPQEVRSLFFGHIRLLIDYCDRADLSKKESLEMLAASILSTIDGKAPGLPAFELRPSPCSRDKEDAIEHGENWFPDSIDIAGSLKDEFYQRSEPCL